MVTHDQEEAMTMANRIAIMSSGWIAQVGSPIDIYESPNSRMTAEFIGSVNIFEANILEDNSDSISLTSDLLDAPVFIDRGVTTPAETTETLIALRPEKIYLTTEKPEGDITSYYVKLASGKRVQATLFCLLIGYPMAYASPSIPPAWRCAWTPCARL